MCVCTYFKSPGGIGRVRLFGEETRGLGPLVEQVLGGQALSLRDVPDLRERSTRSCRSVVSNRLGDVSETNVVTAVPM